MQKSHKRKLPIGWRRLTPTEKITKECKFCGKQRFNELNPPIEYWGNAIASDINRKEKDSVDASFYIYIKPIKSKAVDTNITPQ